MNGTPITEAQSINLNPTPVQELPPAWTAPAATPKSINHAIDLFKNRWGVPMPVEAPTRQTAPDTSVQRPNFERSAGELVRKLIDAGRPMGSWTGLPTSVGAPLSGLLLGTGAGLAINGLRKKVVPWITGKEPEEDAGWGKAGLIGALAGLGLGGYAAYKKASAYNPAEDAGRLIRIILHDRSLSETQKQEALNRIETLSRQDVYRLNTTAALGALTGAALATILGVGPLPGFIAGGMFGSAFAPRSRFTF